MPKRTGQITDLERYFWKAESIQKFLRDNCAKKILEKEGYKGKIDVGSKEFVRVASEFGHLESFYQKRKRDAQVDCSGKSEGSGRPTYLFTKCLACRIITQLDAGEKAELLSHFDKKKMGHMVLSKKEMELGIWDEVTDIDLKELLQTQCYFQKKESVNPDKGDDSQTSSECWMHDTDKCSPQILLDLCSIFKQGRGKGITAFTHMDLQNMYHCLCVLFPLVFSENAYIHMFKTRRDKFCIRQNDKAEKESAEKAPNLILPDPISSNFILRNGIKNEDVDTDVDWEFAYHLTGQFRNYFIRQFEDKDKVIKWFQRLTQKYRNSQKHSLKQDNLYPQVQRWHDLWEYVICRYKALRSEEIKQTRGTKEKQTKDEERKQKKLQQEEIQPTEDLQFELGDLRLEILLEQAKWEYAHKNVCEGTTGKKKGQINCNTSESDLEEDEVQKKCYDKINAIADLIMRLQKEMKNISPETEGDVKNLTETAFLDLEKVVGQMEMGWCGGEPSGKFTRNIIKEMAYLKRLKTKRR